MVRSDYTHIRVKVKFLMLFGIIAMDSNSIFVLQYLCGNGSWSEILSSELSVTATVSGLESGFTFMCYTRVKHSSSPPVEAVGNTACSGKF